MAKILSTAEAGGSEKRDLRCGVESIGEAQIQFRSQYYLYAIIFLIFDVEAIFLVRSRLPLPVCDRRVYRDSRLLLLLMEGLFGRGQRVFKLGEVKER